MSSNEARRERFAIEIASGRLVSEAASAVEISTATASRWLANDEVQGHIASIRADVRRRIVDVLAASATDAAKVLHEVAMDMDAADTARVSAARAILSETRTYVEVEELRQRIEALEAAGTSSSLQSTIRDILSESAA